MKYKVSKDRKFSVDGINICKVDRGDILDNPTPAMLEHIGGDCEKYVDEEALAEAQKIVAEQEAIADAKNTDFSVNVTEELTPQQKAANTRAANKAKKEAEEKAKSDDVDLDDLDLDLE